MMLGAGYERVPVLSHLRPRKTEDFCRNAELECAQPFVSERCDEAIGCAFRVWHDTFDIRRSCR